MHLSDAHHSRKVLAGACMVVAPIFLLVATVIHPASDMDEATQVATIADNLDAWYVAHLLAFVAIIASVPAVLGLMHMLREREVAFGHLGGALALFGLLVLPYGWMAGMVILAIGLYRARAVQSTTALLIGVAALFLAGGAGFESEILGIVGSAVMLVGLGGGGWTVLRESDEDWEHTPEHGGFRPLAGM